MRTSAESSSPFRADVHGTPIKVTVLYPGYIVSAWPWGPLGFVIKGVPVGVLHRMS